MPALMLGKISLADAFTSLGYGGVDIGLMELDERRKYEVSFKNATDWSRVIVFGSCVVAELAKASPKAPWDKAPEILFHASGPKVLESLYELGKTEGKRLAAAITGKAAAPAPAPGAGAGAPQETPEVTPYAQIKWG